MKIELSSDELDYLIRIMNIERTMCLEHQFNFNWQGLRTKLIHAYEGNIP